MKKTILAWLIMPLLLCGCGGAPEETTAVPTEFPTLPVTEPSGFYRPDSAVEAQTGGAVRAYPLEIPRCQGFTTLGDRILIFSDGETGTKLTLLTGDTLTPTAQKSLDILLHDQTASIQADAEGVSYFDELTRETVILDESLREITRIAAPEGLTGYPILSADRQIIYYCTSNSICAMDLETRLPRVLRQYTGSELTLDGIHMNGTVLKCSRYNGDWQTFFLSAENGQLLEELDGWYEFSSQKEHFIVSFPDDGFPHLVFGTASDALRELYIPDPGSDSLLLEKSFGVLSITAEDNVRMDYYDLTTGCLASTLTLKGNCFPTVADSGSGILWLLVSDAIDEDYTLYRWDTNALPSGEDTIYSDTYYTRSNPDLNGIAQCQTIAREMSDRHGVEILVWEDAIAAKPWDYRLTEEYLVPVLKAQLTILDRQLSHFPEGFFETLSEDFSGLTICLVRQLQGDVDYGSVESANGLQYWIDDHAYIALSTVNTAESSFYHELCHVMDTRIIAESNAYDQWEELNPSGFEYDYDYIANASRNAGEYLRSAERCFIDTYSMSFPKEDRARVLEYAMTEGNEEYFQSKTMQNKLKQICIGIREAFGLKKSPETFLWEQYLQESLAYSK